MIRLVIDTNVFISALLQPQGPPAQVLLAALVGTNYLVTGNLRHFPALWAETDIVTARQFMDVLARLQQG
jgi:hypothetical protein